MTTIGRRLFMVFGVVFFATALILPITGYSAIFKGSDFEKLERDPIAAAICVCFILIIATIKELAILRQWVIRKRGLLFVSVFAFLVAIIVMYLGHVVSSGLLLSLTAIQFRDDNFRKKN
jgi:hypothetical protein